MRRRPLISLGGNVEHSWRVRVWLSFRLRGFFLGVSIHRTAVIVGLGVIRIDLEHWKRRFPQLYWEARIDLVNGQRCSVALDYFDTCSTQPIERIEIRQGNDTVFFWVARYDGADWFMIPQLLPLDHPAAGGDS